MSTGAPGRKPRRKAWRLVFKSYADDSRVFATAVYVDFRYASTITAAEELARMQLDGCGYLSCARLVNWREFE